MEQWPETTGMCTPTSRWIVRTIDIIVCALFLTDLVILLSTRHGILHSALCVTDLAALSLLQLVLFHRPPARFRSRTGYLALAVQAVFVFLPFPLVGHAWLGMVGLLAGSALLVLPPVAGWPAFAALTGLAAATQVASGANLSTVALAAVATAMTGLVVRGLSWLESLAGEVTATRHELTKVAVAEERLRVSRDLHDLIGYGLSAIKLKSELTHRLMHDHPDEARHELEEVLNMTGDALADVRWVARGYRPQSFEDASRSVRSVLTAADVELRMELDHRELPEHIGTVLATVLREGITNVLRHSDADACEIIMRQTGDLVSLDIVNDGAAGSSPGQHGSGVRNLAERLHDVGGRFTAGPIGEDRFHLHASIPL